MNVNHRWVPSGLWLGKGRFAGKNIRTPRNNTIARLDGVRRAGFSLSYAFCTAEKVEGTFEFADRQDVKEKRTEVRIPLMALVDILWTDGVGSPRVSPARLEDKSPSGLSVRMKEPVGDGTHVTARWGTEQVQGVVTNCRRQKEDYIVGVRREIGVEQ